MLKYRRLALVIAIMALGVFIVGCTQGNNTVEEDTPVQGEMSSEDEGTQVFSIVDDFGREVTLQKAPERIISLTPSNTEILYALGLGERIVGVSIFDDYPAEVLEIEKVGDFNGNNIERIIELEPDLVVIYGEGNEEENFRLDEAGINYVAFEPESIEAVIGTIEKIGRLTGKVDEAETLIEEMNDHMNEVLSKIEGVKPRKVFYEIWHEPLMAAGPGSFMDELMTLVGGDNIAKDTEVEYPQFDLEQLIKLNPEVYLTSVDLPEKTVESISARPGYENIDAIINEEVHLLDPNVVSRPGPRIIQALELVAKAIHPEIFK
ncbi:cobalamin-binding protein [Tissierella sp. Yu-01]|uniref:ABC transporter substrate-binding protein n=1 Tax=Tissierella sp. Yu-01 TaxID=3035694 RepID=UPI00240E32CF|nr:cobalamin-binding protein [Tissierella sp. Yu-01]WFA10220.1 cobalamin-binding protein [Tissierella sp. Yu-01]